MTTISKHRQLVVVVAAIERKGNLLMLRRHDPENSQWHQRWNFPGGKIEANETPLEALQREIKEETLLEIHSEKLLGVHTHHWNTSKGIQQTFILLYHCQTNSDEVKINQSENDSFIWEKPEAILKRSDLLDGIAKMLQDLFMLQT